MRTSWWLTALALAVMGCEDWSSLEQQACANSPNCDGGTSDAGASDAGTLDAGEVDAGPPDAGVTDSGIDDAGVTDSGIDDAGVTDSGIDDAGVTDSGIDDAGVTDSGIDDEGVTDAGFDDAGITDAGFDAGVTWLLVQYLKPTAATPQGTFGSALAFALGSDRLYVGAPGAGKAYWFTLSDAGTSLHDSLTGNETFGAALGLFDGGVMVGEPGTGKVVFWRDTSGAFPSNVTLGGASGTSVLGFWDGTWATGDTSYDCGGTCSRPGAVHLATAQSPLVPTKASEARFGTTLAASADESWLAVSAPQEAALWSGIGTQHDAGTVEATGAVYLYQRVLGTWTLSECFAPANPSFGQRFGDTLGLTPDGGTLVVGVTGDVAANDAGAKVGSVSVFTHDDSDGGWQLVNTLRLDGGMSYESFGTLALSRDGATLAVGAPGAAASYGQVLVYDAPGRQTRVVAALGGAAVANSGFGSVIAVSPDGRFIAVGAPADPYTCTGPHALVDHTCVTSALDSAIGAVYLYRRSP
jgi:hypothetical protein